MGSKFTIVKSKFIDQFQYKIHKKIQSAGTNIERDS